MKITINGHLREVYPPLTLHTLVERFAPNKPNIIAEVNGHTIKRHDWKMKTINDGDKVELVNIVGGG